MEVLHNNYYAFHDVALQCEHTFFPPPRGASDRPLVVFSIAVGARCRT